MKKQSKKINLDASTSLPVNSPQTPKFPLHSPLTPNTPQTPNPLNFSPTLPTFQELGDNLDNLLGWKNKYHSAQKLLSEKEQEILRLETVKSELLEEKEEFEQQQTKQSSRLVTYTQQITHLKLELKESNDDFLQISEKNEEKQATIQHLTRILQQEKQEKTKEKRHSNSPLFVRSPSPEENVTSELEKLMGTVNDLELEISSAETEESQQSEVLTELETLKENQLELEKAWKTLADERIDHERLLQNFNEKELKWEKERAEFEKLLFNYTQKEQELSRENQSLKEELAEKDYQLSETKSKKNRAEKVVKEINSMKTAQQDELESLKNGVDETILQNQILIEKLRKL